MNLPEKKAAVFRAVLKLLRQGRPHLSLLLPYPFYS